MKSTTRWRFDRTRDVTLQQDPLARTLIPRIWNWHCREERVRVRMGGPFVEGVGSGELDHTAEVHDGDPVADVTNNGQVMGDEQVAEVVLVLEVLQEVQHLRLDAYIER